MRTSSFVFVVLSIALCVVVEFSGAATDYCAASLCSGKKHIGCNNNGAFGSKCSSDAQAIAISSSLKSAILDKHNTLRNTIAKGGVSKFQPAGRMATMQWDSELASLALLNAKQCDMVHDACRATANFPYAGQNLGYTGWSGSSKTVESIMMDHIQAWYNENKDATMSQINSYSSNGKVVGHFTQMTLEKATHVGCGIVRHTKNGMTYQYIACDYAFITFVNKPVYVSASKGGSQCKTGTNPSYTSLCSTSEVFNVKQP